MTTACWEHSLANVSWHASLVITHLHMQWPTFACQIAHCPAWLTVGTSPCGVALGGSRGHARAEERAGGRAAFLAAKGPGCQAGLCQPVPPTLDTSLELICLAVGSVCKLHRPFAAPLRPLAWPSKGSRATADWQAVSSAAHGCHTIRSSQLKDKATHTYKGSHRGTSLSDAEVTVWPKTGEEDFGQI